MSVRKLIKKIKGLPSPTVGDVIALLEAEANKKEPRYTTGHCDNNKQPGGCQLHNLFCNYPECDRKLEAE